MLSPMVSGSLNRAMVVSPATATCSGAVELRLQATKEWDIKALVADLGLAGTGANCEKDELG